MSRHIQKYRTARKRLTSLVSTRIWMNMTKILTINKLSSNDKTFVLFPFFFEILYFEKRSLDKNYQNLSNFKSSESEEHY